MITRFITSLVGALLLGFLPTYSENFIENGINYGVISSTSPSVSVYRLPDNDHYSGDIIIPPSVEHAGVEYMVTGISNWAFQNCSGITSIHMPSTIKEIGDGAFEKCTLLTHLSFPDSIKYLPVTMCYGCENLSSLELPSGLEGIGRSAFYGCASLKEFEIPDSVKEIDNMAFKNCTNLEKLYWGKSVEIVSGDPFAGCYSLYNIYINDLSKWCKTYFSSILANPLNRGGLLYLNNEKIDTLYIPDDIDVVRKNTFYNCSQLVSIIFPDTNIKVESEAFSYCI